MAFGTKVYFEDSRAIIVLDNLTEEDKEKVREIFQFTPIKQVATNLLSTEKIEEAPSIPNREPDISLGNMEPEEEPENVPSQSALIESAKALLNSVEKQQEIGIDKTILTLATVLEKDMDKCEASLASATQEQKVAIYNNLRDQVLAK